ncbi:Uncharacterized conserved protein, contains ZZ-type Zn-finger [Phaffia rhodozyma]|uniref:Uncharacterized conserved protein, contains ZZ-type Zn-finger n=1 Tax=Phaffia rhodozyma TaxID=264483 RepID=A0A0F7SEK4_PHARH|nr:Uncharacterized conserved protein, contains ZZ-type Zn-finger [Phaffia rhodozyma]
MGDQTDWDIDWGNLTLVFKVTFGTDSRQVTYPKGRRCQYEGLRGTVERLFSLSASSFLIAYTDDDGDENPIRSDLELSEAVSYFYSGTDDLGSTYTSLTTSTYDSSLPGGGYGGTGKITLPIQVIVEYDGPSLSDVDVNSIAESLEDRESNHSLTDDESSHRSGSSSWSAESRSFIEGSNGGHSYSSCTRAAIEEDWGQDPVDTSVDPFLTYTGRTQFEHAYRLPSDMSLARPRSDTLFSDSPISTLPTSRHPSNNHPSSSYTLASGSTSDTLSSEDEGEARTSIPSSRFHPRRTKKLFSDIDPTSSAPSIPSSYESFHAPSLHSNRQSSHDQYGVQTSPEYGNFIDEEPDILFEHAVGYDSLHQASGSSARDSQEAFITESSSSSSSGPEINELGARWLKEQEEMLQRKARGISGNLDGRRGSENSVEGENTQLGGLELERDPSGRWYYRYSTDSSNLSSNQDYPAPSMSASSINSSAYEPSNSSALSWAHPSTYQHNHDLHQRPHIHHHRNHAQHPTHHHQDIYSSYSPYHPYPAQNDSYGLSHQSPSFRYPLSQVQSSSSLRSVSRREQGGRLPQIPFESLAIADRDDSRRVADGGGPFIAPTCNGCGTWMGYMRYICVQCGEADSHPEGQSHHGHQESNVRFNGKKIRSRTSARSITSISGDEGYDDAGYSSDQTEHIQPHSPSVASTSPTSSLSHQSHLSSGSMVSLPPRRRGFELCPSCIETSGVDHSRTFYKVPGQSRSKTQGAHAFREVVWDDRDGWKDVEYDDDSVCSICKSVKSYERYRCVSCQRFDLCSGCFRKMEEIHPSHAFLSLPPKAGSKMEPRASSPGSSNVQHLGAFCHNCLKTIVGPRFHCAICPSWDLCGVCEGLPIAIQGAHQADHIMMKIPVPLGIAEVEQVSRRARDQWLTQDAQAIAIRSQMDSRYAPSVSSASSFPSTTFTSQSPPVSSPPIRYPPVPPMPPSLPPLPPLSPRRHAPNQAPTIERSAQKASWNIGAALTGIKFRKPPTQSSTEAGPSRSSSMSSVTPVRVGHMRRCADCDLSISGPRYQCANCPSDPLAYNLCATCERRSYLIHDPMHVFIRFDRPVDIPVKSLLPLLPVLYKTPAGSSVDPNQPAPPEGYSEAALKNRNLNNPTMYLNHLYHPSTVCDLCMTPISGKWYRCAVCEASFDLCADCHGSANHDKDHVFVVFKSNVDMSAFRDLTALSLSTSLSDP